MRYSAILCDSLNSPFDTRPRRRARCWSMTTTSADSTASAGNSSTSVSWSEGKTPQGQRVPENRSQDRAPRICIVYNRTIINTRVQIYRPKPPGRGRGREGLSPPNNTSVFFPLTNGLGLRLLELCSVYRSFLTSGK